MSAKSGHILSSTARAGLSYLAASLSTARKEKMITMAILAERVGVSRKTLGQVFKGDDRVAAGVYFETAYVLGVPLFETDPGRLAMETRKVANVEALMIKRVRQPKVEIDDDF